jgi:ATP-dependent Clp protease ATP-binding subunit ClpC
LHVDILPMGIVASTGCWGLVAAGAMTIMAFVFGAEQEALDLWAPAAWQSFELAGAEAARFHHDFIGTEHVLLGLLGEENGKVGKVLENLGVRRENVRAEIEKIVGVGPQSHTDRPARYTPRAKKAFQFAIREAKAARAVRAEPEHVLLGLLDGCGGVAALVLKQLGVDADKVREQIRKQAEGTDHHE